MVNFKSSKIFMKQPVKVRTIKLSKSLMPTSQRLSEADGSMTDDFTSLIWTVTLTIRFRLIDFACTLHVAALPFELSGLRFLRVL